MIPSDEDEIKRRQSLQNLRRARYGYYALAIISFLLGVLFLRLFEYPTIFDYLAGTILLIAALYFWDKGRKIQIKYRRLIRKLEKVSVSPKN